ncbi:MAG: FAD-dependent oxidoreductase [Chloroflexota bacterium]
MSVAYTYDVLIVGAGLAGLTAARELSVAGLDVIVVEKGRLPGGRLATLAVGEGRADAGAQFFTVRTDEFAEVVDSWRREGLVFEWSRGWSDGSLAETVPDGYPRYAAIGGFWPSGPVPDAVD